MGVRSHVQNGLLWMADTADTTLLRDEGRTSERARETEEGRERERERAEAAAVEGK